MIPRFNLHTHTLLCDGSDSAEDMVRSAISCNCEGIGFSGHSHLEFAGGWCMSPENTQEYIREILCLKEKYKKDIEIRLGIEYDFYSELDTTKFEYIIGSVHYVEKNGHFIPVDETAELLDADIKKYYNGDYFAFCSDYYKNLSLVYEKTHCDIVGHFDLVSKFNENNRLFDENDARYRNAAFETADALMNENVIFEINTGAISRGYRKFPYPARFILEYLAQKNARITVTTDTHSKDTILYYYDEAIEYARSCGIKELYFMKNGKFQSFEI